MLVSCGRSASAPTPAATPLPLAAATLAATTMPAPTASPTVAEVPSSTPAGATANSAPPTPVPPTQTPAPNPAATIVALNARFPSSGYDFQYRPLAFQIDNAPVARPQTALSHAY